MPRSTSNRDQNPPPRDDDIPETKTSKLHQQQPTKTNQSTALVGPHALPWQSCSVGCAVKCLCSHPPVYRQPSPPPPLCTLAPNSQPRSFPLAGWVSLWLAQSVVRRAISSRLCSCSIPDTPLFMTHGWKWVNEIIHSLKTCA